MQRNRAALISLGIAALAITGCVESSKRIPFNGEYYRANASAPRSDRHDFTVTSGPLQRGFEGARQAAFYEGTRHCIQHFGTSDIDWTVHPTQDPATALTVDGNRIVTRGRCLEWPIPEGAATGTRRAGS